MRRPWTAEQGSLRCPATRGCAVYVSVHARLGALCSARSRQRPRHLPGPRCYQGLTRRALTAAASPALPRLAKAFVDAPPIPAGGRARQGGDGGSLQGRRPAGGQLCKGGAAGQRGRQARVMPHCPLAPAGLPHACIAHQHALPLSFAHRYGVRRQQHRPGAACLLSPVLRLLSYLCCLPLPPHASLSGSARVLPPCPLLLFLFLSKQCLLLHQPSKPPLLLDLPSIASACAALLARCYLFKL